MDYPKRKPNRLNGYDYSAPNAYFITICTRGKQMLFWEDAGAGITCPQDVRLSRCGQIADRVIHDISNHYPMISIDNYVVMPNHIHLLLQIHTNEDGQRVNAPKISTVIQQMKGVITKQIGSSIWQKLFHDHVIRGDKEYEKIWRYIDMNPVKWTEDCVYSG